MERMNHTETMSEEDGSSRTTSERGAAGSVMAAKIQEAEGGRHNDIHRSRRRAEERRQRRWKRHM